jgi:hypothetical protein
MKLFSKYCSVDEGFSTNFLFADYTEEPEDKLRSKHEDEPSLTFSNTETLSSWMREANMDAEIHSYTKSSVLRRDEYFFRIW